MRRKIVLLIVIFSAFGWLSFLYSPSPVEATPQGGLPAAEFAEKVDQSGGHVITVLQNNDTLIVAHADLTILYDGSDIQNPTIISKIEGFSARVLSRNYLYGLATASGSTWAVWDIANPLIPVQIGTFETVGRFLAGSADYLIFDESSQYNPDLAIYSLSDPTSPHVVGHWNHYFVRWAELDGSRLYAGAYSLYCDHGICDHIPAHLAILDLSDPANPTHVGNGSITMSASWYSTIHNGYLYQRNPDPNGSDSVDISQISIEPATVTPVASIDLDGFYPSGITLYENTLYLTDGIRTELFDITDPTAPAPVATLEEAIVGVVYGNYLYRVWTNDWFDDLRRSVTIYDLTAPADPLAVKTILTAAGDWMHKGANNLLYIADTPYDYSFPNVPTYLYTVDISNPDEPSLLRSDPLQPNPNGSSPHQFHVVQDNYLYVTRFAHQGTKDGVDIYRLPTATTPLTFIRTLQIDVWQTAVVDNAFLVQKGIIERELDVYNTEDPENPFRNAQLTIEHRGFGEIMTEGNFAYLLEGSQVPDERRLFILDITLPGIPRVAGSFDGGFANLQEHQWTLKNGYIYYPHVSGLGIADVRNPATPLLTVIDSIPVSLEDPHFYTDGQRLYIMGIACGVQMRIFDLTIPTMPRLSTLMNEAGNCSQEGIPFVSPQGDYFYIADDIYGVRTYQFVDGIAQFLPMLNRAP